MISTEIEFHKPASLDEALALIARHGENAKILAGGMSLVPMMTLGLVQPQVVISLNHLSGLAYVQDAGNTLKIGAMTRHFQVATDPLIVKHCPMMVAAALWIGDVQVRNRGTIGGSLAHADPAADYPPVLLAVGARFRIRGGKGERTVPVDQFFVGMMESAVGAGELLLEVEIPKTENLGWSYQRLHRVEGSFAIVNVAALHDARARKTRVAIGGACPKPFVLDLSDAVVNGKIDAAAVERKVLAATGDAMEDLNGDAEYRQQMSVSLTMRALNEAISRSGASKPA